MYLVNENFDIKVGEIVAFDIGDFLDSINKNITLIRVLEVVDREPIYDYEDNFYTKPNPLVKYETIDENQVGECDIAWVFTKEDVEIHLRKGCKDGILKTRIEEIKKEFETLKKHNEI